MESGAVWRFLSQQDDWRTEKAAFFRAIDLCVEAADNAVSAMESLGIKVDQISQWQAIATVNHYKAINSLISTSLLCQYGLVEDAKTLVRKLIEIAITLKYIERGSESRAKLYSSFEILNRYRTMRDVCSSSDYSDWLKEEFAKIGSKIVDAYNEVKEFYPLDEYGEISKAYKQNWSGTDLRSMARECSMVDLYCLQYKPYCAATHASADDAQSYVDESGLRFGQIDTSCMPGLLWTACHTSALITGVFMKAFSLNDSKIVLECRDLLTQLEGSL